MFAILGFILALALAIAIAPLILGVFGTMLALLFTALLYLAAGCPKHEAHKPTPAEAAERAKLDDSLRQLEEWEREDRQHAKDAAEKPRRRHAR